MKRVHYITGAAGYLGSWVARYLLEAGESVRGLVLPGDPLAAHLPEGIEQVAGDLLKPDDLARFLEVGQERERLIIHCAGMISMSMKPVQKVFDINVTGTSNLLALAEELKVRKFVHVSSVHALPELPHGQTQREVKRFDPQPLVGAYAKTKAIASQAVMDAADRGLEACMIHPSGIFGPGDWAVGHFAQLSVDYAKGRMPAGVQGGYSFCDVRDVARAAISALTKGERGEGYIVASYYVTVRQIFDALHAQLGGRPVRLMLPLWLARLALPIFWLYYRLSGKRQVVTSYALYTLGANGDFDNSKARRQLGFDPRSFEESMRDSVAWLREVGKI